MNKMTSTTLPINRSISPLARISGRFNLQILPWLMLAISLAITYQLWSSARDNALQALHAQFDYRVRDIVDNINTRMKTYEQVMRGVDGLFSHSRIVDRGEFRDYIAKLHLKESYPGIQGIRFVPAVSGAAKERFIAAIHKEGFTSYTIWPEGQRDIYAPVAFIEPFDERNQKVFGYDMLSDRDFPRHGEAAGLRRAAMEQARDTGNAAISGKIMLLFETEQDRQAGFVMFLPVYKHGVPHNTIAERRANLIGWICSVFRMGDLMKGVLGGRDSEIDIEIYDGNNTTGEAVMYDSTPQVKQYSSRFQSVWSLNVAGRTWTMSVHSLPGFEKQLDVEKLWVVANSGMGVSVLLTLIIWLLGYSRKRAMNSAEMLQRESRKSETMMRTASDGIHIFDSAGHLVQVNDAFCSMLGYTSEEMLTMNIAQLDANRSPEEIQAAISSKGYSNPVFETCYRRRDGSIIDIEISSSRVGAEGQLLIFNSARDITERKRTETALRESEARLHATIENAMDAVVQMDSAGIITGWNSQAERIFGWSRTEALGRKLQEAIIPPQYREAHAQGLKRFLLTGVGTMLNTRIEITGLHRDGREFPVELSVASIMTTGKHEFSAFIRDITKRKESEDLIWKQANFDMLTGLPNRRMFYDRLAQEIKKAHRAGLQMALLFIDLDKFKEVNDTLGHGMGDIMLMETSRRIGECVRETDIVARLGGDEFTVVLAELADASNVERVAENILQKLAEPFRLGNEVAYVSASIGITLYPVDAIGVEDLLKNADQAMYLAKSKGRNRFCYFTPSMQQAAQTRLKLINELRVALADNQFRVYYQPIVDLTTGRINKAEALIRWQHPRLGLANPVQFIHLAEETGMIVEIGDWIFKESARQLKRWRVAHNTELQISVNVSPVQFSDAGNQHRKWFAYLQEMELAGRSMVIEITEGLLLDAESGVAEKLLEFRDAGMQASIDDFGTGYSALSYLKKFDIDYLKIDQSFVRNLATDFNDLALCEAIIVMAHKLELKVIAEGVETEEQRSLLAEAGCDYAQGYLYSRPLPADEFEKVMKDCNSQTQASTASR
jgi:diguanylate cyclase (GGDEF)-like protein/PAS domain S-box-containing protein